MIRITTHRKKILLVLVLAVTGCGPPSTGDSPREPEPAGIDPARMEEAFEVASRVRNMKSLLVWRNGRIVAERYFQGTTADELHDVRSVTKSVLSALVGIAIEEGHIPGTDRELSGYIEPVVKRELPPAWKQVRLEHLLTMTAGHDWKELGGPSEFMAWIYSPDRIDYVLKKEVQDAPGSRFCYSEGSAHLMSVALTEAVGMSAAEYARRELLDPLGIGERPWLMDRRGYNLGGVGLKLTPRDMVAFGVLYLQRGVRDGVQIVPERWVDESTRTHVVTLDAMPLGPEYGYYWWVGRLRGHDLFFATGYGGQFIVVVPGLNAVVVATSNWLGAGPRADAQWSEILLIITGRVLPSFTHAASEGGDAPRY